MSDAAALKTAIGLLLVPSRVRMVRAEPLPAGVVTLLQIAAGDDEAERGAAVLVDRSRDLVHNAATFFIEQILLAPQADSYRVLGAQANASAAELRRNVGLLLRWLHPDHDPKGKRSLFAGRVTAAWNDLKTPERRAAYDLTRRRSGFDREARHQPIGGKRRRPGVAAGRGRFRRGGLLRRAVAALLRGLQP